MNSILKGSSRCRLPSTQTQPFQLSASASLLYSIQNFLLQGLQKRLSTKSKRFLSQKLCTDYLYTRQDLEGSTLFVFCRLFILIFGQCQSLSLFYPALPTFLELLFDLVKVAQRKLEPKTVQPTHIRNQPGRLLGFEEALFGMGANLVYCGDHCQRQVFFVWLQPGQSFFNIIKNQFNERLLISHLCQYLGLRSTLYLCWIILIFRKQWGTKLGIKAFVFLKISMLLSLSQLRSVEGLNWMRLRSALYSDCFLRYSLLLLCSAKSSGTSRVNYQEGMDIGNTMLLRVLRVILALRIYNAFSSLQGLVRSNRILLDPPMFTFGRMFLKS